MVFGLGYYAFRQGTGAGWAIALALITGSLAKESFVFLLPWLLWYGRRALPITKQIPALALGMGALYVTHWTIDTHIGVPATESVNNALSHFENVSYSLRWAATPKGLGELISIFGFFSLAVPLAFWWQWQLAASTQWLTRLGRAELLLLAIVAIHMLLFSDLGRMGYFAAPVFCAVLASVLTQWRQLIFPASPTRS